MKHKDALVAENERLMSAVLLAWQALTIRLTHEDDLQSPWANQARAVKVELDGILADRRAQTAGVAYREEGV